MLAASMSGPPTRSVLSGKAEFPMTLLLPEMDQRYSREAFRQWCKAQPKGRYERVDGRIVAMAPERGAHLRVKGAVYKALDRAVALAGVECQALPDGATVETATATMSRMRW